jgi:hypothetical protein
VHELEQPSGVAPVAEFVARPTEKHPDHFSLNVKRIAFRIFSALTLQ